MSVYNYGGVHDYLQDIHFPRRGTGSKHTSKPWFYWLLTAQPLEFSYLAGVWGNGWAMRDIFGVIKILAASTQPEVKIPGPVGNDSLEGAADRVVTRWDQNDPLDPEFFGRFNFSNKFFWKVIGKEFPKWATNLAHLPTSRVGEAHGPISDYITETVNQFMGQWNSDSAAYTAQSIAVSSIGFGGGALMSGFADGWPVKHDHSFAVPFPSQDFTFNQVADAINGQKAWFGPIPPSANFPEFLILTQGMAFQYGYGQLDDNEWDMSHWPPRRTSIPQREGGSGRSPSAITHNYNGNDPNRDFLDSQPVFQEGADG